jgi:hypothetical protein
MNNLNEAVILSDLSSILVSDLNLDVDIPYDDIDDSERNEIESVIDSVMVGLSHLWRHGKKSCIEVCELSGKNNKIVKPDAYFKREDESSLSVFDLIESLKVNNISYLQVEADRFITAMGAEVLCTSASSQPIALLKTELLNVIERDADNVNVIREIVKSEPFECSYALSYHWDINLPDSDNDRQLLYGILAMSSVVYENRVLGHKEISIDLKSKREIEKLSHDLP